MEPNENVQEESPPHDIVTDASKMADNGAEKKEKTNKKRMHQIQSRYLQAATSSTKKNTPLTRPLSCGSLPIGTNSNDKQSSTKVRKKLFKGPPSTPVRAPEAPKVNLKIKKSITASNAGPVVALPSASGSDDGEQLNGSTDPEESQLLSAHYLAVKYLCCKTKESLDKLCVDAPRKLWLLKKLNGKVDNEMLTLEVEYIGLNFLRLYKEHLAKQKEIQDVLTGQLSTFAIKFSELADGLEACLHYLPLRNLAVPRDLEIIEKVLQDVDSSLDLTGSKMSLFKSQVEELATCLLTTKTMLGKQVETICRSREVIEEFKKVSGVLTYQIVKKMQERTTMSEDQLCHFDFL